jgi:hypothetical protein
MNYNPYAAPQAAPPPPPGPGAYTGAQQPWDVGEVLSLSFEGFKANWPVFVGACLVYGILILPFSLLPTVLTLMHTVGPGPERHLVTLGCTAANSLIQAFLLTGMLRIFLAAARGQQPEFGLIFSGGDRYLDMLGFVLLKLVITIAGCICVGVVLIYMGLCFADYYIVDQNLGPAEALKEAWRATDGQHVEVLVYSLLGFVLLMLGACVCGFGMLVAAPIVMLGYTIIYLRITGRGAPPPLQPGGPGYGPPAGGPGYGPPGGGGGYGPPGGYGPGGGGYGGGR